MDLRELNIYSFIHSLTHSSINQYTFLSIQTSELGAVVATGERAVNKADGQSACSPGAHISGEMDNRLTRK